MASSHKIIAFCLCLMLASFGVLVDAGSMMDGWFGGGGKGKGKGGHGAMEALLVAGLLASLLKGKNHHSHHHQGHHHHGAYSQKSAAYANPQSYAPVQYGLSHQHGYGYQ